MEYRFKDFRILKNKSLTQANQYVRFDKAVAADVIRFHKSHGFVKTYILVCLR